MATKRRQLPLRAATLSALIICGLLIETLSLQARHEPTVDELKARVAGTPLSDRAPLCIRIVERQLNATEVYFPAGDSEKAKAALVDMVAFAEQARESAIQSHKHEKQCEIAIRKVARKLDDLKHTVSHQDQEIIQNVVIRLQRIRDDLLVAMFPKVGKQ